MKISLAWMALIGSVLVLSAGCEFTKKDAGDGDGGDGDEMTTDVSGSGGDTGSDDSGDGDGDDESDTDTDVVDVKKGERGASCDAADDCADGLSCIVTDDCPVGVACANKSCQPSDFDIMGTGKECYLSQCGEKADCCGDMPLTAPSKCDVRTSRCTNSVIPGCVTTTCTDDDECGGGRCTGTCYYDAEDCQTVDDCAENTCNLETQTCTLSSTYCTDDSYCSTNTCSTVYCHCDNPDYDPTDPICSDEECEGICGYTCEDELCVADTSCHIDADCLYAQTPFCSSGECVECKSNEDCEEEDCIHGRCGPRCEQDSECGLFEICQDSDCVYVGCQTDRECVLGAQEGTGQDPRLFQCLIQDGIGSCRFPCEIDAQCAPTEICVEGLCEYIGCETDLECKTIAGLHNQPPPTDERPWTTKAQCRAASN